MVLSRARAPVIPFPRVRFPVRASAPSRAGVGALLALFAAGCTETTPPPSASERASSSARTVPVDPDATGSVGVTVRLEGELPAPVRLDVSREPACAHGEPLVSEALVHTDGRLAGALVHAVSGHERFLVEPPVGEPVLRQVGCRFTPHVLALRSGQTLRIENDDPVLHNVRLRPRRNPGSNRAQAAGAAALTATFERPELSVPVQCDLHPWMGAWLHVLEHPWFAVTDAEGRARIEGLPAGEYELEVLHETLGARRLSVTVAAGRESRTEATFAVDSSP